MQFTLLQTQQQARPHITRLWGGSASLSFRRVLAMGKPHTRSPGARPVSKLTPLLGQLLQSQSSILPTIDVQIHLYNPRFQDHTNRVSQLSHTPPMFLGHYRWTSISPESTSSMPFPMPQTSRLAFQLQQTHSKPGFSQAQPLYSQTLGYYHRPIFQAWDT